MTDLELKKLEEDLWHSADLLRADAHMSSISYGEPILGLIFRSEERRVGKECRY